MKINAFVGVLAELVFTVNTISGKLVQEKEKYVKAVDVNAVEGRSISLPCPISVPIRDVYMVLWFKDNSGIPLYSFDVRDKSHLAIPKHWSAPEIFGPRANFNTITSPESLVIQDIKRHDQGIYRCRIDFRTSQTQTYRYNLSIIILPEQPTVLDRWGRQLNGTLLGPKQEGDDIMITCRVIGGRPQPDVKWLINGLLVDDQIEHNSGDVIENRLLWPAIQRSDLNSIFSCQAVNTQLVEPKESSFVLDMHLKPLTVEIMNPLSTLTADQRYELTCESTGSRPNAIITWYKGKRQLRKMKEDISNNTTKSQLTLIPSVEDNGKSVTCRAENPSVNGLFLEKSWKLDVVYPPIVTLHLGSTLTADDIKEGDDVYFECHVSSNPPWRKLEWLHNGLQLTHNATARIIRSNQSLVLQKVTRFSAGNYACSAHNVEGETVSEQQFLRVRYAPFCKTDKIVLVGAAKDESIDVLCEVYADPPARKFRWKFNNSGETLDMDEKRYTEYKNHSILRYTPVTDQDFGTLTCWASNEVGTQLNPCLFQVVFAGLPAPVSNCSLQNITQQFVEIQCVSGYDGGLPQMFILELVSKKTGVVRLNFSNFDEPNFVLDSLDTLNALLKSENNSLTCIVYAVNQKGRSLGVVLKDLKIGEITTQSDFATSSSWSLLPIVTGIFFTIVLLGCCLFAKLTITNYKQARRKPNDKDLKLTQQSNNLLILGSDKEHNGKMNGKTVNRWQNNPLKMKVNNEIVEDEKDPDVIPSQYVSVMDTPDPKIQSAFIANDTNLYHKTDAVIIQKQQQQQQTMNSLTDINHHLHQQMNSNNYQHRHSNQYVHNTLHKQSGSHHNHEATNRIIKTSSTHEFLPSATATLVATTTSTAPYSNHQQICAKGANNLGLSTTSIFDRIQNKTKLIENSSELDVNAIRDRLMNSSVPESCV